MDEEDDLIIDSCNWCGRPIFSSQDYRVGRIFSVHTFCQVTAEAAAAEKVAAAKRRLGGS